MNDLTLTELNQLIQETLNDHLEPSYWVVAEIGEMNVNARGHCYLELVQKEEDAILAKARATIWSYTYRNLSAWFFKMAGTELQAGMRILANIQVSFHEVYGLSLNIKDIDASYTIGERALKRQETLQKLQEDGVLDMNKLLELPIVPQNIAIISSPTAAGFEDFKNQIEHNPYGYQFHLSFYQATMQGETAADSIIDQLHAIIEKDEGAQVVVIIRGGGGKLDLDCFDDYELSAHIAQCPIPVITGIGHERDQTISDIVAHTNLKTPTAVAEFLINGFQSYEGEIDALWQEITSRANNRFTKSKEQLGQLSERIGYQSSSLLNSAEHSLLATQQKLTFIAEKQVNNIHHFLNHSESKLELLSPENVLKRGYSYTLVNNHPLKDQRVQKGDELKTYAKDYTLTSEVTEVKQDGKDKL